MSRADWCARSVREIQTKSGRESRPTVLPLPDRTHNESSKEAHIWHTKRRRKANTPGVLEKVSLIGANQGRKSISSFRMIQNSERDWQYSEQRIPAILGALRREENALWSLFDEKSRDFARKYTEWTFSECKEIFRLYGGAGSRVQTALRPGIPCEQGYLQGKSAVFYGCSCGRGS